MSDVPPRKKDPDPRANSIAETVSGLFSTLADAMPQMVWATDANGVHFYQNRRWYEYTGMTEADSMGFGFAAALHPEDYERTVAHWRRSWEGGESYDIEYRFRRADGVYRWFVGRASPIRDARTGGVQMWVGTCTDIDDARRALTASQESRDQLTVALRAANLGTWQYEFATEGMTVSAETREIFGIERDGLFTVSTFSNRIHPDYVAQVLADFGRVVSRETDEFVARYPVIRPDDSVRHVHLLGRYYADGGGGGGGAHISGVIQDVTDSQNALDALQSSFDSLQDSQGKLALALQTARLGTWEYDFGTRLFEISPRTMDLFGVAYPVLSFAEWDALIYDEDRESVRAAVAAMIEQAPPYEADDAVIEVQCRARRPDGTVRYLLVTGSRVFGADGKAVRVAGVTQDITEERNRLDAMRESAEALLESETRFRSVVGNAPIIVFALDKNGIFTFHDGAGLVAAGRQPGFSVGRSVWEVYAEIPELLEQTRRALAGETTAWRLTIRGVTYDTKTTPILGEGGEIEGIIGVSFDVTEESRANAELALREEQYRFLFRTVASGVVYQDGDARIQDANPAAERILGLTLAQMQGRDSFDPRWKAVREDGTDLPGDQHPVPVAIRTGQVVRDMTMGIYHPAEERYRWLSVTAVPLISPGASKPQLVYAYIDDHTERREAEESLRDSESRFRDLADNISQLAWMTDETGWVSWYNRRWFDYTGTTLEEMQGWGWHKVHHPDYARGVTERFADHVNRGAIWEDTFPLRGADGAYRWFLSRAVPLRDDGGKIVRWFGTNTDVTDSRRAEEEIRRSEERFRSLITATAQIVWTTRATGAVVSEQPDWAAFTGQSFDEYRGAGWLDAVHEDDRDDTAQAWQEAVATYRTFQTEHRLRRADGGYRYMSVRAVPVREASGAVREWIGVHTDINDRKEAEFALSEYATRQAHVAETLQRSLLNTSPKNAFPGVTHSTKYEPALDEAQVGGDFFDLFALRDGKIALVVGDVTGKGLKAAEHTGQIKYALRAFLRENPDPADALSRVNRLLTDAQSFDFPDDDAENNAMAAATVAVLDSATGILSAAGGGAEYPVLYRASSGACEEINTAGLVIGAYGESVYEPAESRMEPGDLLILTTDGITEARRSKREFFGNEGVISVIQSVARQTDEPEAVAVEIIETARRYSASGTFRDDVCLLVLRKD